MPRVAALSGSSTVLPIFLSPRASTVLRCFGIAPELQIVERNVLGGITRTSVIRDCLGNPMSVTETVALSANSSTPTVKNTEYDYDDRGRLVSETVTINNSVVSSTSISYDELGRPETVSGNGLTHYNANKLVGPYKKCVC